jgi:hypothetical protein
VPFLSKIEEKEIAGAYATSDDFNNANELIEATSMGD